MENSIENSIENQISKNNFGPLRLMAALLVIIGHSFSYGGYGTDPLIGLTNNQVAIGRFPVDIFYVISGYLICQSYFNTKNVFEFA